MLLTLLLSFSVAWSGPTVSGGILKTSLCKNNEYKLKLIETRFGTSASLLGVSDAYSGATNCAAKNAFEFTCELSGEVVYVRLIKKSGQRRHAKLTWLKPKDFVPDDPILICNN